MRPELEMGVERKIIKIQNRTKALEITEACSKLNKHIYNQGDTHAHYRCQCECGPLANWSQFHIKMPNPHSYDEGAARLNY